VPFLEGASEDFQIQQILTSCLPEQRLSQRYGF
jgi:hypothetical protein